MALTVVTGRANAGKTGVIYGALSESLERGEKPTLLLPTRPDVARATAELSSRHPLGLRVDQLDGWIAELWGLHGDGRRLITPEQRSLIVRRAVARARLHALSASAGTPGFGAFVEGLAREAAEEPRSATAPSIARNARDRELLRLLESYRGDVDAAGLIEPAEAARDLANAPPAAGGRIAVHRFSDLSPSQEALVTALSTRGDVWVSLPWEEGFPATEALDGLVTRLLEGAERVHLPAGGEPGHGELARLEASLFQRPEPQPPTGSVRFCTAAGAEAEAALIAETAAECARAFGAERVAVVFRDAESHAEHVARAMSGAGVPFDLDILVPLSRTPLGSALDRILSVASGLQGRESLAVFLKGPFSGADRDAADALDARWRGTGTIQPAAVWADAARLAEGTAAIMRLAKSIAKARTPEPEDWQNLVSRMFGEAYDRRSLPDGKEVMLDAAAHRRILEIVSHVAELAGPVACVDILAALREAEAHAGTAERPGRVQVTEAHRLRGRRFDAVIVGGLTASGFSTRGRISVVRQTAARLLGAQRPDEQASERLLFYDVCTRARRLLVLTRQTAGSDGEPRRPSVFWEEALDLFAIADVDSGADREERIVAHAVTLSDLERAAPAITSGRAALREAIATDSSMAVPARAPRTGLLVAPELLRELSERQEFSATELEAYARCPYRWFYERAVRPEALDTAFDALSQGDLAHRALATFYGLLPRRTGSARVTPEILSEAVGLAEEAFEMEARSPRVPRPVTLAERDSFARARAGVLRAIAEDATFLPGFSVARVEMRFGGSRPGEPGGGAATGAQQAPPALPAVDLGGFRLCGTVDRVDESPEGLAVIDYKSGRAHPRVDIERERRIQVPLYAAAVRKLLGRPIAAGLYRSLRDGGARGFWRADLVESPCLISTDALPSAVEADELLGRAVEIACDAADGIRRGAIPASPATSDACRYCSAAAFCGAGCPT